MPKDEQMCFAEPAAIDISKAALGGLSAPHHMTLMAGDVVCYGNREPA